MTLFSIALDNLIRRKGKTAFLIAGILIGITASTALLSISQAMKQDFEEKIERYGANLIITPKKEELPLTYGSVSLPAVKLENTSEIARSDAGRLAELRELKIISPKIIGAVFVKGRQTVVVGVDFRNELKLKSWWEIKGALPVKANQILAGSNVVSRLNLSPGSSVEIENKAFIVTGSIAKSGSSDDDVIFTGIDTASTLLNMNDLTLIEAASYKSIPAGEAARMINKKFPSLEAKAVTEALTAQAANIRMFTWFSAITSLIILFVASLIIFITTASSVNERTREIGIFRAIGFRKKHVFSIFLMEALMVALAGGIVGSVLGSVSAVILRPLFATGLEPGGLNLPISLFAILAALLIGLAASYIPARRAAGKDPAEALRFI